MKLLPETPRTARRSSKPSALSATPSTKVPTTNKLMAQILLHGTLHATVYEVDKLKIGGGNFLTKISLLIILQWYQRCLCYCLLQTENKPN
ncbi:uncharacterized protein LOC114384587 isoform X5 [Glycine soja]|nr:uncharacterized protein LOC114384587 isoform X5 [Glycine soja]